MRFLGAPYPIVKNPKGFFRTQSGTSQIKSDLLVLLLTNPGERVMLLDYGTPLSKSLFEPNDASTSSDIEAEIISAISTWEPRVVIQKLTVSSGANDIDLNPEDALEDLDNTLSIKIEFADFENIQEIDELVLEIPLGGS